MTVQMLKGKIHRATVKQAELNYVARSRSMQTCWMRQAFMNTKRSPSWILRTAIALRPIRSPVSAAAA